MTVQPTLAEIAGILEQSPDYRVLRRLVPRPEFAPSDGQSTKIAILLDVETTGLDTAKAEIIELGMVKFTYLSDGRIGRVIDTFSCFNQPSIAIPIEITALTGITHEMVKDHGLDEERINAFVSDAVVVIDHNAGFDRKFMERYAPLFTHKAWACSVSEVEWRGFGFEGSRLSYLLTKAGLFHETHRAIDDCLALLEILAMTLPQLDRTVLSMLLERARRKTIRIWAEQSPFERKDELKRRGYRWSDGTDGRPRSWYIDVDGPNQTAEIEYLQSTIYQREAEVRI